MNLAEKDNDAAKVPMPDARQALFDQIRNEIKERLNLIRVSSPAIDAGQHRCFAWDATSLPTESHYVPVFLDILEQQERSGQISPETHILVETTTGNAGAAVAWLAKRLDYDVIIFIPEDMPAARIADVRQYLPEKGIAELRLTPKKRYVEGMVVAFRDFLINHKQGYQGKQLAILNHSRREESICAIDNVITALLDRSQNPVRFDTAVVALGNGTTATGIARALRRRNADTRIMGVEPAEAPWIFVQKYGEQAFTDRFGPLPFEHHHEMIGTGGWGVRFPNFNLDLLDDVIPMPRQEWWSKQAELRSSGLHVGNTSAACLAVVDRLAQRVQSPTNFFTVVYDPITKY